MDPEEGLAGPVANQQGLNLHVATDKNQQEPSTSQAHEDSGCYSIDQSTSDQAQNGGSMSKGEVETSTGMEEQQDNLAVKESEAVVTELEQPSPMTQRPCEVEDNIPSFPVSGPPISENEDTTTNVQEMASPLQGTQDENAELGNPHLDTQHNASGETFTVSSDKTVSLNKTVKEPNLGKLHSRKVAIQEKLKAIETRIHEKRYILVHRGQDVDQATLKEIVCETCQEIFEDRECLLSFLETTESPTFSESAPKIRNGSPDIEFEDPKAAHSNLSVSPSSSSSNISSPAEMTESPTFSESAPKIRTDSPDVKDHKAADTNLSVSPSSSLSNIPSPAEMTESPTFSESTPKQEETKVAQANLSVSTTPSSSDIPSPAEDQHVNTVVEERTEETADCPESVPKDDKKPEMLKDDVPKSMVLESNYTQCHCTDKVQEEPSDGNKEGKHQAQRQLCSDSQKQMKERRSMEPLTEQLGDSACCKNEDKQPGRERQKGMTIEDQGGKKQAGDKMQKPKGGGMSHKKEKNAETKSGNKKKDGVFFNKPLNKSQAKKEMKEPGAATNSLEKKEKSKEPVKNGAAVSRPEKTGQEMNQNKSGVAPNNNGKNWQSKKVPSNMQEKRVESSKSKCAVLPKKSPKKDPPEDRDEIGNPSNTKTKKKESAKSGVLLNNRMTEDRHEDKDKAGVPSDSLEMKSSSKPVNRCHDADQDRDRKKKSGDMRDHGKNITPEQQKPSSLSWEPLVQGEAIVEVKDDDITTFKKLLRQISLPEGQEDATAEEKTLIKAKEQETTHKVSQKKPELKRASNKRDEKLENAPTSGKQGCIVQIRGDSSPCHGDQETPSDTEIPKRASLKTWMNRKISFLIVLLLALYNFLTSWSHKDQPPDVKSYKTNTSEIALDHVVHVQVYHMQREDQDSPPDTSTADNGDNQVHDYYLPDWLVQEDVDDDDLNLGADDPTVDHPAPITSVTVTADLCTEGSEGGQIAVLVGGHTVQQTDEELSHASGHSSQHIHRAPTQEVQDVLAVTCALEAELQHYRETERGISVTVLDIGGQVLDQTRIFGPTTVQEHLLMNTAARAFAAGPMHGFTVRWPGGRTVPLGTCLDPHTAQNIILQMYHADEGGGTWQWRIVEISVGGISTYTVEVNIHQQANDGQECSEQDWPIPWDSSEHGSRGHEEEKVKDEDGKGSGYLCTICMDVDNKDSVEETLCRHCFHRGCLRRWLEYQNKCPVCRNSNPQNGSHKDAYRGT
ncbi:enolase-phosphatase E1-like [Branchiostoma lanceolatum]|uniref:enolase-phosphatase E1-like n=1 Tax=Branchiostoma lanceolatum TaxID=7740 RepID=UPI0034571EE8